MSAAKQTPTGPADVIVVCGLGNPGDDYALTRHNAGFCTVDLLAERHGARYWKSQAGSLVTTISLGGREIVLAKPQSMMNVIGGPTAKLLQTYGATPSSLLVIHDEIDIAQGDVRVKFGGGADGHNGLRSIINKLGTRDFSRLRFGVGRPPGKMQVADFVLRKLKGQFLDDFMITAEKAADVAEACITRGVESLLPKR